METRFVPNPVSPDLYRDYTISFPGGSLTASKDVLTSMFEKDNLPNTCEPEEKLVLSQAVNMDPLSGRHRVSDRAGLTATRSRTTAMAATPKLQPVNQSRFLINNSYWTARLVGSHQAFMDYLCTQKAALVDGFTYWQSAKGSPYFITDNSTSN